MPSTIDPNSILIEPSVPTLALDIRAQFAAAKMDIESILDAPEIASASTVGRRAAALGDSRVFAFNTVGDNDTVRIEARNWLAWASALLTGRLIYNPALAFGYSGENSAQLAARYDATIGANYDKFDILFLEGPTNDLNGTTNPYAENGMIVNMQAMVMKALDNGKTVVLMPISPRSLWVNLTSPQIAAAKQQLSAYNRWAARYANETAGVLFINTWPALSQASGDPIAGSTHDNLHFSAYGALVVGQCIAETLTNVLPNVKPPTAPSIDTYNATFNPRGNIVANPGMTGTGGTKGAFGGTAGAISGTVPTSWDISKLEGTQNSGIASSIDAATSGFGGRPARLSVAVSLTSGASDRESIVIAQTLPPLIQGNYVSLACELDVSEVVNLKVLQISLEVFGSSPFQQWVALQDGGSQGALLIPDGKLVLQTPIALIPAGVTGANFRIYAFWDASASDAGGTIKLSNPEVRYVAPPE